MSKLNFVIPKGHLEQSTLKMLQNAGYRISGIKRTYRPLIDDPGIQLKVLRPQEIPNVVESGSQDIGIAGLDWIKETGADVEILQDLEFAQVKIIVAIPKSRIKVHSFSDLIEESYRKGKSIRISTEYLNIAKEFVKSNRTYRKYFEDSDPVISTPWWKSGVNEKVIIILSFGATEAKPPEDADVIIDVSETGTSLEHNNLKIIETILDSTAVLIANKSALKDSNKKEKICDVFGLLKGVVDGRDRLHIFVNVSEENLPKLLTSLPALKSPTIAPLSDKGWYSINTVIQRSIFLEIVPIMRKLAQGLIVLEPRQVLLLDDISFSRIINGRV